MQRIRDLRQRFERIRAAWYRVRHPRQIKLGRGVSIRGRWHVEGEGRLVVGSQVAFDCSSGGNTIHLAEGAVVTIGDRCYINGLELYASRDVQIGADCIIGDAWISTSDFHPVARERRDGVPAKTGPVTLEANVWLAARTAVLRGVTIGADSVVAYGTVVTRDVPRGVVVASHQTRIVGEVKDA